MDKSWPAARFFAIPNEWFDQDEYNYIDIWELRNMIGMARIVADDQGRRINSQLCAFNSSGILINTDDNNNTSAIVRVIGVLEGDNYTNIGKFWLTTNVVHPLRFKRIYFRNGSEPDSETTGRGIKIVGQSGHE